VVLVEGFRGENELGFAPIDSFGSSGADGSRVLVAKTTPEMVVLWHDPRELDLVK
jgi:hypothetical protein